MHATRAIYGNVRVVMVTAVLGGEYHGFCPVALPALDNVHAAPFTQFHVTPHAGGEAAAPGCLTRENPPAPEPTGI